MEGRGRGLRGLLIYNAVRRRDSARNPVTIVELSGCLTQGPSSVHSKVSTFLKIRGAVMSAIYTNVDISGAGKPPNCDKTSF